MKYWRYIEDGVEGYASGATRQEAGVPGSAVEVPRLPKAFERWANGAWVEDDAAKAADAEDRRLRDLSPGQMKAEAVRTARLNIVADLEAEGVINGAMATKLRTRIGNA